MSKTLIELNNVNSTRTNIPAHHYNSNITNGIAFREDSPVCRAWTGVQEGDKYQTIDTCGVVARKEDQSFIQIGGSSPIGHDSVSGDGHRSRLGNIEENLELSVRQEIKEKICRIVSDVNALSDLEKLFLYLKLPTGAPSADDLSRKTPTSCLYTSNRVAQAQAFTWIKSHLEEDNEKCLLKHQVYDSYRSYCTTQDLQALGTADFGKVMKCIFPDVKARRLGQRGNSKYCYSGLRERINIEPPILPELEVAHTRKIKDEVIESDGELVSAACELVCEWAQKLLGKNFISVIELAEYLISNMYVNSKTLPAFTVMANIKESQSSNVSPTSTSNGMDRHKETTMQLQRQLKERELLKEQKKKLQLQRDQVEKEREQEQQIKQPLNKPLTPSMQSPNIQQALQSPVKSPFRTILPSPWKSDTTQNPTDSNFKTPMAVSSSEVTSTSVSVFRSPSASLPSSIQKQSDTVRIRSYSETSEYKNPSQVRLELSPFHKLQEKSLLSEKDCHLISANSVPECQTKSQQELTTPQIHVVKKPSTLPPDQWSSKTQSMVDLSKLKTIDQLDGVMVAIENTTVSLSKLSTTTPSIDHDRCIKQPQIIQDQTEKSPDKYVLRLPSLTVDTKIANTERGISPSSGSAFVPFSQVNSTISTVRKDSQMDISPTETSSNKNGSARNLSLFVGNNQTLKMPESIHYDKSATSEITRSRHETLEKLLLSPEKMKQAHDVKLSHGYIEKSLSDDVSSQQTSPMKKGKSRFTPIRPKTVTPKTVSSLIKDQNVNNCVFDMHYDNKRPVAALLKEKRSQEAQVLAKFVSVNPATSGLVSPGSMSSHSTQMPQITPDVVKMAGNGDLYIILGTPNAPNIPNNVIISPNQNCITTLPETVQASIVIPTTVAHGTVSVAASKSPVTLSSISTTPVMSQKRSTKLCTQESIDSVSDMNVDESDSATDVSRPNSVMSRDTDTPSGSRKRKSSDKGMNEQITKRLNSKDNRSHGGELSPAFSLEFNRTDDILDLIDVVAEQEDNRLSKMNKLPSLFDKLDDRRSKSCTLEEKANGKTHPDHAPTHSDWGPCPDILSLESDALMDTASTFLDKNLVNSLVEPPVSHEVESNPVQTKSVGINAKSKRNSSQRQLILQKKVLDEKFKEFMRRVGIAEKEFGGSEEEVPNANDNETVKLPFTELPESHKDENSKKEKSVKLIGAKEVELSGKKCRNTATYNSDISNATVADMESYLGKFLNESLEAQLSNKLDTDCDLPQDLVDFITESMVKTDAEEPQNYPEKSDLDLLLQLSTEKRTNEDCNSTVKEVESDNRRLLSSTPFEFSCSSASHFIVPSAPQPSAKDEQISKLKHSHAVNRVLVMSNLKNNHSSIHQQEQLSPNQKLSGQSVSSLYTSPRHQQPRRQRGLSEERAMSQTPMSDAGYHSFDSSPVMHLTPVTNSGSSDSLYSFISNNASAVSRSDSSPSVYSSSSDQAITSPVPQTSIGHHHSSTTSQSITSPPVPAKDIMGPLNYNSNTSSTAFTPIDGNTFTISRIIKPIRPVVTIANQNTPVYSIDISEALKSDNSLNRNQVDVEKSSNQFRQHYLKSPPSYDAAVKHLNSKKSTSMLQQGTVNNVKSISIQPAASSDACAKNDKLLDVLFSKDNQEQESKELNISSEKSYSLADTGTVSYPFSYKLALLRDKSIAQNSVEKCQTSEQSPSKEQPSSILKVSESINVTNSKSNILVNSQSLSFKNDTGIKNVELNKKEDGMTSKGPVISIKKDNPLTHSRIATLLQSTTLQQQKPVNSPKIGVFFTSKLPDVTSIENVPNVDITNIYNKGGERHVGVGEKEGYQEYPHARRNLTELLEGSVCGDTFTDDDLQNTLDDLRSLDSQYFPADLEL